MKIKTLKSSFVCWGIADPHGAISHGSGSIPQVQFSPFIFKDKKAALNAIAEPCHHPPGSVPVQVRILFTVTPI